MESLPPIAPGIRLGPYEVLSSLGAGGMGEVYRARDDRLGRTVAIKVLGHDHGNNPELRERFRREARALSRFSHPHICNVFDVGTEDGRDYFVMELLEGETLAQRLERGALPLERALEIAAQIVSALATSHRMGVVHRDLKPANIMLTPSGAKLLDFGLVRFAHGIAETSETVSQALTTHGMLLGTVQYMSPEQIEGREADARSDLFSFGAVVYEMIAGQRAFTGNTQAGLIGAILKDDPPSLPAAHASPSADLNRLIGSCLAKSPDDRWQSARDLQLELSWLVDRLQRSETALPRRSLRWWIAAAGISAAVASVFMYRDMSRRPLERPATRSMLPPPENSQFISVGTHAGPAVLSPDGRHVAFLATTPDGRLRLWIQSLDSLVTHPLNGTEGASYPFWSPGSDRLGFFADRKLKTITLVTGAVATLVDAGYGAGGTWNRDDTIVFAPGLNQGLLRVTAGSSSTTPASVLAPERGDTTHRWPAFLPDGRHFLFTVGQAKPGRWMIRAGSLDSDQTQDVIEGDSNALYANGALIFTRSGTLLAQPIDEGTLRAFGNPTQLAENVLHDVVLGRAVFSTSETGSLVYQVGSAVSGSRLMWVNRSGKELGVVEDACFCIWPRLSPDERRMAVAITNARTGSSDIWTYELGVPSKSQLTFEDALEANPEWTPGGDRIVFTSTRRSIRDVHWMDSRGGGPQESLWETDGNKTVSSISLEGVIVAVSSRPNEPGSLQTHDLWLRPWTGDRAPRALVTGPSNEIFGQISPDRRWFLYQSNQSGRPEIYVTSFPALQGKRQISDEGGILPRWSRDGKEIFYLTHDHSTLFAAGVATEGDTLQVKGRERLFSNPFVAGRGYPYDVSPDKNRFLIVTSPGATSTPLTFVVDWPSLLKR
jgi:serine/threonine protein kinase